MGSESTKTVSDVDAGQTVAKLLRGMYPDIAWSRARDLCESGRVSLNGAVARDSAKRLKVGDVIEVRMHAPRETSGVLAEDAILYVDRDVVVVNKPAGVISVPYEKGDRDTLVDTTRARLRRIDEHGGAELGVVQRLDKETSGVMVFARTLAAKRELQQQWRVHAIERVYSALAHGVPHDEVHESWLIQDRGDGIRGSFGRFRRAKGNRPSDAQRAVTQVRLLEGFTRAALVECTLETGRQHQIRIHLSEAGHPLLGERVYNRYYRATLIETPRVMLHARVLGFNHPRTERPLRFECEPPSDFMSQLQMLRENKR